MMVNTDMVYCVECKSIMAKGNAEKIFKTGFYNTTIPLGQCKECASMKSQEADIDIVGGTQVCYSDYAMPLSL